MVKESRQCPSCGGICKKSGCERENVPSYAGNGTVGREIMTREEMMADDTQYCCYCGQEKVRFHCCGENHFQTFAEMDKQDQDEFFQDEE